MLLTSPHCPACKQAAPGVLRRRQLSPWGFPRSPAEGGRQGPAALHENAAAPVDPRALATCPEAEPGAAASGNGTRHHTALLAALRAEAQAGPVLRRLAWGCSSRSLATARSWPLATELWPQARCHQQRCCQSRQEQLSRPCCCCYQRQQDPTVHQWRFQHRQHRCRRQIYGCCQRHRRHRGIRCHRVQPLLPRWWPKVRLCPRRLRLRWCPM
mmetsp:Transcript_22317/g.69148  ORF Transcript_22317/g.69148 Transcript_22317/m.69148 type:complete len:213 (-) Transcript_22317:651-1289(-)